MQQQRSKYLPDVDCASVIAGGVCVNALMLLLDAGDPNKLIASALLTAFAVWLQPQTRKILFAAAAFACVASVFHSSANVSVSHEIRRVDMLFVPSYFESSTTTVAAAAGGAWEDTDHSLQRGAALLTRTAQTAIRAHQGRCHAGMRIYQPQYYEYGMGSELHFHASILALAIEDGALFAWGDSACTHYSAHCRDLYQHEHACTPEQTRRMDVVNFTDWPKRGTIPTRFVRLLPASFTQTQQEYWWKTQGIGYLLRFNAETRLRIKAMRRTAHHENNTLISGAINVNIRGGDKRDESKLSSTESYVDKAAALIAAQPLSYSRTLYVTSDSLEEILRAKAYAGTMGLHVIYSDVPRMAHGNQQGLVNSFWDYDITISVLMQLAMTAECDAWIGTRSSNWNRVIDIYRCSHAFKCKQSFIEAGDTEYGHYDSRPFGHLR